MILTMERPSTIINISEDLSIPDRCEALLDGRPNCPEPAEVIVRFASHGCPRDGHGVLLCGKCRDWIAAHPVGCGRCHQNVELFIVSSVSIK